MRAYTLHARRVCAWLHVSNVSKRCVRCAWLWWLSLGWGNWFAGLGRGNGSFMGLFETKPNTLGHFWTLPFPHKPTKRHTFNIGIAAR